MPTFEFTSPEGKTYEISGPEGATKEQAWGILHGRLGGDQQQQPAAAPNSLSDLKQFPLGIARGAATGLMPEIGAAQLQMENMSGMPAPKPSDYAAGVQQIVGGQN